MLAFSKLTALVAARVRLPDDYLTRSSEERKDIRLARAAFAETLEDAASMAHTNMDLKSTSYATRRLVREWHTLWHLGHVQFGGLQWR